MGGPQTVETRCFVSGPVVVNNPGDGNNSTVAIVIVVLIIVVILLWWFLLGPGAGSSGTPSVTVPPLPGGS